MANSPPSSASEKAALRKTILRARDALDEGLRREGSQRITERVLSRPEFINASGVHCFISLPEEVDTEAIFEACWSMGKATYVPYLIGGERRLGWARRARGDRLVAGKMNLLEPAPENRGPVPLAAIDLLLVPGVAFDRNGGRLGYGKGFYDKFLGSFSNTDVLDKRNKSSQRRISPCKMGLAFSTQIVDTVPRESWDIGMDVVITEMGEWEPKPTA